MRRVLLAFVATAVAAVVLPSVALAQVQPGQTRPRDNGSGQQADGSNSQEERREPRLAPLGRQQNAGPCPYVKILYDAARYVEFADNRPASANVGYTGEIQGLSSACAYQADDPIRVDVDVLFALGRGPRATENGRTYRYWIAVTARDSAVLAKQYFDLPVDFEGADRTTVTEQRSIEIPRADITTSGANFEVLIGFDVTPQMAEFNRTGSRFRMPAALTQPTTPPAAQ